MDWTPYWGHGRDYHWRDIFVGDYGFSHDEHRDMWPPGSFLEGIRGSDYQGPFGVLSFGNGGEGDYTPCDIPFRNNRNGALDGLRTESLFGRSSWDAGGENQMADFESCGRGKFGSMDLFDMNWYPYHFDDCNQYGQYGQCGYDG